MALAVLPDFSRIVAYGTDVDVVRLRAPEGLAYRGTWFDPTSAAQWSAEIIRDGGQLTVRGNKRADDVVLILAAD